MRWLSILRGVNALGRVLPLSLRAAVTLLTRFGGLSDGSEGVNTPLAARAVRWYGLVGLLIGCIATLPVWLWTQYGSPTPPSQWLGGWAYTLLTLWSTRGLHADGLADVADACGSGATGARFWDILRDSRVGAFGTMALIMVLVGLICAATARVQAQDWLALVLAPVYSRSCAVLWAYTTVPHNPHSLGGQTHAGATVPVALTSALQAVVCLCLALSVRDSIVTIFLSSLCLWTLRRTALRHGGGNGDFLGVTILCTEVVFLIH